MRPRPAIAFLALALSVPHWPCAFAQSAPRVFTTTTADAPWGADTTVQRGDERGRPSPPQDLQAKNHGAFRKAYLRFGTGTLPPARLSHARLTLTVQLMELTDKALIDGVTFRVYGLNDGASYGAGRLGEDWDVREINWKNAPANDLKSDFAVRVGGALADGGQARLLGTFNVNLSTHRVGTPFVALDSAQEPRLLEFLRQDRNGHVTFVLTRITGHSSDNLTFVSGRHRDRLQAPTLSLEWDGVPAP
jgi:hypothetical protein